MAGDGFFKSGEPIRAPPPTPTAPTAPTPSPSSFLLRLSGLAAAVGEELEMEMRSSSLQCVPGACGLNLTGKLSFEEESSGSGGSSFKAAAAAVAPPLRKGKGVAPPPRCLVEGCGVDLTGAKAYYCRHKVCGMHSKAPRVIVAGMEQRFCQQCSRFHQLQEFDQGKRSCRRRLACHNERRRKPPPRPLLSQIGHLSSTFHEDNRFRGFLVDFTSPKMPALVQDVRQIGQAGNHGGFGAPASRVVNHGAHAYIEDPMCEAILSASGTLTLAGGCSDSTCALSLLSTQPWDNSSRVNHQPTSSPRCSFEGTPIVGHSSWGSKGLEGSSSSTSFEVRSTEVGQPANDLFSGELELALLGKRQCMGLDHSRRYRHSDDDGIGWSL